MTLGYNADGVLAEGKIETEYGGEESGDLAGMFGTEANDQLNVDVNMLFLWGMLSDYDESVSTDTIIMGRLDRLGFLRLLGKGSSRYMILGGEYDAVESVDMMPYSEQKPGTEYSVDGEYTTTKDDEAVDYQLEYEFNADKSIKSISYKRIWVKLEYTRWFRVTDQIMEERPDGTTLYYAEEIPGRYTEKEVDRADATYIFRFEY